MWRPRRTDRASECPPDRADPSSPTRAFQTEFADPTAPTRAFQTEFADPTALA